MNKAIYIATSEQNSGKSIITLGLMSMLMGKMAKVGYFRPIVEDFEEGGFDNHIETVIGHFGMDIEFEDGKVTLQSGEMFVVPKGVRHKPGAKDECQILLVEPKGVVVGQFGGKRSHFDIGKLPNQVKAHAPLLIEVLPPRQFQRDGMNRKLVGHIGNEHQLVGYFVV